MAPPNTKTKTHNTYNTHQTFDEEAGRGSEQERAKLDLAYAQQRQVGLGD